MKKILMVVALAATVVTGLAGRTTKATAEATATIVGNVLGPDGAPISAFVNAVGAHSGLLGTTTAAGHFELTVPADTYKVFAMSADQYDAAGDIDTRLFPGWSMATILGAVGCGRWAAKVQVIAPPIEWRSGSPDPGPAGP